MTSGFGDDLSGLFGGDSFQVRQGANITPPVKVLGQYTERVFRTQLAPFTRAVVGFANPSQPTLYSAIGTGNCNLPDSGDHPILVGYSSADSTDEYGFDNEGGPMPHDDAQMTETSPGNSIISGLVNPIGRQNPFQTDTVVGRGIGKVNYGGYKYQGQTTPTGKASKIKKKPLLSTMLGRGMYFTQKTNGLTPETGGNEPHAPSSHPKDNVNAAIYYATIDLAKISGVNLSGLDFGGDDKNGLLFQANEKKGLTIGDDNLVAVKPDGETTFFNAHGEISAATGGALDLLGGRAITLSHDMPGSSGSSGSSSLGPISVNVDIARVDGKAQAGLCDVGGDDDNGLMVNLLAQNPMAIMKETLFGAKPNSYPAFMPSQYKSVYLHGYVSYQNGIPRESGPHSSETSNGRWWLMGHAAAAANPYLSMTFGAAQGLADSDNMYDASAQGSSVEAVDCGMVTTGSGLTIKAGDGNQMAVWLAKYGGSSSSSSSSSASGCNNDGPGLAFLGDDGEGLGILLQTLSGMTLDDSGLALCIGSGLEIDPHTGKLQTVDDDTKCATCLAPPPPVVVVGPPTTPPPGTPPGTVCTTGTSSTGTVTTSCTTTTGTGSPGDPYPPPGTIPIPGAPPGTTPGNDVPGIQCSTGAQVTQLPLGTITAQGDGASGTVGVLPLVIGSAGFIQPSVLSYSHQSAIMTMRLDPFGNWLQGHIKVTVPLQAYGYYVAMRDTTANDAFSYDLNGFLYGAAGNGWVVQYQQNNNTPYIATGPDLYWAMYVCCDGTRRYYVGTSPTDYTEVYHDPVDYLPGQYVDYCFRALGLGDGGPRAQFTFAEVDSLLAFNGIPAGVTIHNFKGTGTTYVGTGTMPNPNPNAYPPSSTTTTTTQPPVTLNGNLNVNGTLFSAGQSLNGLAVSGVITHTDINAAFAQYGDAFDEIIDPTTGIGYVSPVAMIPNGSPGMSGGMFWPGA